MIVSGDADLTDLDQPPTRVTPRAFRDLLDEQPSATQA
jgi:hypothetical protein